MDNHQKYENYTVSTVILSNIVSLAIYALGFFILLKIGIAVSILYLLFVLAFEFRLIRNHCTKCYYWGKTCGFGKGRISRLLFKKGDPGKFCAKKLTWKNMLPDLLLSMVPFMAGLVLVILSFNWILLVALFILLILSTSGNGFIRSKLTCRFCKQSELGCPALDLFNKGK